jgi:hypothetical protein
LRENIPQQDSVRLWRVLQTIFGFRALAVRTDVEVFVGIIVAPPEGKAGTHGEWLNVEFNGAVAKGDSFRQRHALAEGDGIHSLNFFENAAVGLPAVGSHRDFRGLRGGGNAS